jgi:hypothetical protein
MSLGTRSRWIAAATAVAIPTLVLFTACSTDKAAGPASVATVDTVGLIETNVTVIDWWGNPGGADSGYYSYNGAGTGNFVQTDLDGSGDFNNFRLLIQYGLPALSGKGAVDSAKMYTFVCTHSSDVSADSVIVDHIDWGAVFQDSASWGSQTLQANVGTLVRDTTSGWKSLAVTSSVQADYAAKRATTQYRLEFSNPTLPVGDQSVEFAGGYCNGTSNGAAGQGYLVIWAH